MAMAQLVVHLIRIAEFRSLHPLCSTSFQLRTALLLPVVNGRYLLKMQEQ